MDRHRFDEENKMSPKDQLTTYQKYFFIDEVQINLVVLNFDKKKTHLQ